MFPAHPDDPDGPVASVDVMPLQARYLGLEVYGEIRRAGGYATMPMGFLLPAEDTPLDAYGNIPRSFVAQQEQELRVSWAVTGPAGDETRFRHNEDGSTSFLARIVPEAHIEKRFPSSRSSPTWRPRCCRRPSPRP